jgi:serine/threonine-protein kinase/endoribonuclease IRE1
VFLKEGDPNKYSGPIPPPITVLYQLALGLEYIHKMGLIHRDLKPENVLIWVDPKDGRVLMKWADFGLSKTVNERGSFSISGIRGTLNWLAPELLKLYYDEETIPSGSGTTSTKKRGTIQSDVYTEGLVFGYFLLGGVHLFGSGLKIQSNILKNKPVNLDSKFIQIKFNHKVL